MHAARLPGTEAARDAGNRVPVVGLEAFGHRCLVDRRRQPVGVERGPRERLLRRGEARVGEHDDDHVERLRDLARGDHRVEAVLDVGGGHHDLWRVAVAAIDRGEEVALLDLGGLAGRRPAALHVDDDQRHLGHDGKADAFLLERIAGAGRDRDRALARVGRADRECARGDLVLGLMHESAHALEALGEVVRRGRGGRDRVHRADVHAGGEHAERERGVAVAHDLGLGHGARRDAVLEGAGSSRPTRSRQQQALVDLDDLALLLAEGQRDLLVREVEVQCVNAAQHPQHEHVLALARVGDELAALALERHLQHVVAGLLECGERRKVGLDDLRLAMLAPHVLEQDRGAGLEFAGAYPAQQDLLVERDREVGLVAAIGDLLRAHADADAGGTRDAARRRLDLGRDDLRGPDAVAHLRGNGAQRLAAALGAFAGIADHLDDVLGEGLRFLGRCSRRFADQGLVHDRLVRQVVHARSRARPGAGRTRARKRAAAHRRSRRCRAGRGTPSSPSRRAVPHPSPG